MNLLEPITVSDGCQCEACLHPSQDNAGERVLHFDRHRAFLDWCEGEADKAPMTVDDLMALAHA